MINPLKFWRKKARQAEAVANKFQLATNQINALSLALEEHRRETRLFYNSLALPARAEWDGQPPMIQGEPAKLAFPRSTLCRQDSFHEAYFSYWTHRLREGLRYHRKLWEFVFICQVLWERGAVVAGARGLGFGVGAEPLSAFFASQNCRILATDMDVGMAEAMGWTLTNQHAVGKEALRKPAVCPDDLFNQNVSFQACDMNDVPAEFVDFDFCWSACALEHLGSIEKGLAFIERSIQCLKPGGWAVHTTEFNTSSNEATVDNLGTVLFRRRDFEALAQKLRQQGHTVVPFDFNLGDGPVDRYIDMPPYREQPHLQMALSGFSTTSFGIIVQRGAVAATA
ncbi:MULTISPECIES: class I SAM-dependent methyltransferase [Brevundimonas]|uniref:class I SAM-dependent methyltransferase n=1 Tax=Brevundimonas sp. UBA7507 TaxID=1946137 RepID=UPI00257FFD06|nr:MULTISPECIES: class I SAM-dependent methyltransferase [Brevundimonas]